MQSLQARISNLLNRPDITKSRKVQTAVTGLIAAVLIFYVPELEEHANVLIVLIGIFGTVIINAFGAEDKAAAAVNGSRATKYDTTGSPKVIKNQ